MKSIHRLLIFGVVLLSISCNKNEINDAPGSIGISKIIYFPSIATKGDRLIILQPGTAYTELGATASLSGATTPFAVAGAVDATKPGIYGLTYTAKNTQGYTATDYRTVVVIGTDVSTHDYSGTYARYVDNAPNGQTSTWTKTANGVYSVVNPGGATGVTATAVNYSGSNIAIPLQATAVGPFSSTGGVYNATATPPQYQWAIVNAGYGTAARLFIKQ